jgi:hypothetical protein
MSAPAVRSRKVRRILRLEAQAARFEARYAKATARGALFFRRREACLTEARALAASLTGGQLGELARARETPA